jgi:hypothetical protein
MIRRLLLSLAFATSAAFAHAQGLPIAQMQCSTTYAGVQYSGTILFQLMQYSGATSMGAAGLRQQFNLLLRSGRANEIPGTLMMNGHFRSAVAFVDFEATTAGNQGAGAIWINGASHRSTYANFYVVQGGVVAITEDQVRVDYHCQ